MIIYLLAKKSAAIEAYKTFKQWAITQGHCTKIKALRSDQGGEFTSKAFDKYLAMAGTVRKLTPYDTPQLNGIAKQLNCTLLERI